MDLYLRFGNFDSLGEISTVSKDTGAFSTTFLHAILASREWAMRGLLPQTLIAYTGNRVQMVDTEPLTSLNLLQNIIPAILTIVLYVFFVWKTRNRLSMKNVGFIILILLLMLSYASIIVIGRANTRGFLYVTDGSTYYAYIHNFLLLITLYAALNVSWTTRTGKLFPLLKVIFTVCLSMIIWSNAKETYKVNILMWDKSRTVNVMVQEIDDLIAEHSHEDNFSFSISKDCTDNYYYYLTWLKRPYDVSGDDMYSLAEALYSEYYVPSNGEYKVSCNTSARRAENAGN